jgi:DNA-binding transcriptional regulator GbsR (MarR family)
MKPTAIQHDFIERVGRWWEMVGSRSAGRILGWLMICEPSQRSAAELVDDLKLSSGSVSTQTSVLERVGLVERVTFAGDRVSYYRLPPNVWLELMKLEMVRMREMRELAAAAADVIPTERPDRVEDLDRVTAFFMERWPELIEELSDYLDETRKVKQSE